jgi:hypothetical protein
MSSCSDCVNYTDETDRPFPDHRLQASEGCSLKTSDSGKSLLGHSTRILPFSFSMFTGKPASTAAVSSSEFPVRAASNMRCANSMVSEERAGFLFLSFVEKMRSIMQAEGKLPSRPWKSKERENQSRPRIVTRDIHSESESIFASL